MCTRKSPLSESPPHNKCCAAIAAKLFNIAHFHRSRLRRLVEPTGALGSIMISGAQIRAARGLLQVMPGTAKALAISEKSPRANILAGARYLRQLVARFGGNVELALAAYNAGPTAVEKAGAAPSLGTLRYAKNVEARVAKLTSGC